MEYKIETEMQFPMARIVMTQGESARIAHGSMIYRTSGVDLNAKLNASGSGFGKFVKAVARSAVSGESVFITEVVCNAPRGKIAIAPTFPGSICRLDVGEKQYRLNDRSFLAMDSTVNYTMERQQLGKALFGGQGGFFVMTTDGRGVLLINAFGSIKEIQLTDASEFVIDNYHVVAWDRNLNYRIEMQSGFLGSIGTGEGVVNVFSGTGKVLVQSLNIQAFANQLIPFLPTNSSS
ncbi:MAG: TIGR00266 family protein [Clostridiales Family XIII bacterium]|jgi:uncharacterized protein (TIGR00266 family)|nr:TIGR00266 family protein [Clostridiales Family XIII bacterium]